MGSLIILKTVQIATLSSENPAPGAGNSPGMGTKNRIVLGCKYFIKVISEANSFI